MSPAGEILFVLRLNNLGGSEISMLKIASGLKQSGRNVTMAVYGARPDLASEAKLGLKVIDMKVQRTLSMVGPLYRLVRDRRPSVLIGALPHTNVLCILISMMARRGTRIIVTEHSPVLLDPRTMNNWKDRFLCRHIGHIYRYAEEVVAVSKGLAIHIRSLLRDSQSVRVIYNPVLSETASVETSTHPWLAGDKTPLIMGAGRFSQEKNFALLVNAFAAVRKTRPVRLVLLGDGEQRDYIQGLVERLGLRDCVLLPGFVADIRTWLPYATIFVSPSLIEGFGNTLIEAMACHVPVISTDCPFGPAEILDNGRFGCLVPVGDMSAMQAAIVYTLDNPPDSGAAWQRAMSFSAIRCHQAYAALVDEVLARSPASIWCRLHKKVANIAKRENWMLGIVHEPITRAPGWTICPKAEWIGERLKNGYRADPFAWPGKAQTILCEYYDFGRHLGTLREIELKGKAIVRDQPASFPGLRGHLSFPFMFEHDGAIYALPESSGIRKLVLFKWSDQGQWCECAVPLGDTALADGILFYHNDLFWIAGTDLDLGRFDNLNLYYASILTGPWRPHAANPVKCDRRSARCAGPVFVADSKMYRPAQDCSETYGGAIRIMEIVECTPLAFCEREVTLIKPDGGLNPHGFHTLTPYGDNACLVDGKRMETSLVLALDKIMQRTKRLLWREPYRRA
jgi:glycosyltransferase involved in cell wall biosynthesis